MPMRACKGSNFFGRDGGPSCKICKEKGPYACETGTIELTPWAIENLKNTYLVDKQVAESKVKQLEKEIEELLKNLNIERK